MSEITTHFALSNYTACSLHIVGSTIEHNYDHACKEKIIVGQGYNVLHTCIPEVVTCDTCLKSKLFTDHVKMLEEEE